MSPPPSPSATRRWLPFAVLAIIVLGLDLLTKSLALRHLEVGETTYLGGFLPLTLHFNTGGVWGIGGGVVPRWVFLPVTLLAVAVLIQLYRAAQPEQWLRRLVIPLITAGALGNLVDRLRWDRGVVDFIGPVDLGFMLWPIFNIADSAISCCTVLLVLSLWRESWLEHRAAATAPAPAPAAGDSSAEAS